MCLSKSKSCAPCSRQKWLKDFLPTPRPNKSERRRHIQSLDLFYLLRSREPPLPESRQSSSETRLQASPSSLSSGAQLNNQNKRATGPKPNFQHQTPLTLTSPGLPRTTFIILRRNKRIVTKTNFGTYITPRRKTLDRTPHTQTGASTCIHTCILRSIRHSKRRNSITSAIA